MPELLRWAQGVVGGVALVLAVTGCGGSTGGAEPSASGPDAALSGQITVFAASSLTEAFETLGTQFEQRHPGVSVRFNFGPSSGLATQIDQGAPADVFASASGKTMQAVVDGGLVTAPTTFARNSLRLAVPPDDPAGIASVKDLARPGVKLAVCQAEVPCGALALEVARKAGVTLKPVTQEPDVKAVLAKVQLGEVDAGLVYVTDVLGAGDKVRGVEIPQEQNAATDYPIAAVTASKNQEAAAAFVAFVLSADGAAVLTKAGFDGP